MKFNPKYLHELMRDRENSLFITKIQNEMEKYDMEYLVLNNPENVFYATGYFPIFSTFLVVPAKGTPIMIVNSLESIDVRAMVNLEVREYPSWIFVDDGTEFSKRERGDEIDPNIAINMALDLVTSKPLQGKVGIETGLLSVYLYQRIAGRISKDVLIDCSALMRDVRIIKTPWEIKILKFATEQLDKAIRRTMEDLRPGMPGWKVTAIFLHHVTALNLDSGTILKAVGFGHADGPFYLLSGMPRGYTLKNGDIIKIDGGYEAFGYNADIARTFVLGDTKNDLAEEMYHALYRGKQVGVSMLKPGVKMSEVYWAARNEIEKCPLLSKYPRGHVGHSIGCNAGLEEYPQISPTCDYVLQPNMVVSLETPYCGTGAAPVIGGINIEDSHLITEDGHISFTQAPDSIYLH